MQQKQQQHVSTCLSQLCTYAQRNNYTTDTCII
jgi:hypothetical protein